MDNYPEIGKNFKEMDELSTVNSILNLIQDTDSQTIIIECLELLKKYDLKDEKIFKMLENFLISIDQSTLYSRTSYGTREYNERAYKIKSLSAELLIKNYTKKSLKSLTWLIDQNVPHSPILYVYTYQPDNIVEDSMKFLRELLDFLNKYHGDEIKFLRNLLIDQLCEYFGVNEKEVMVLLDLGQDTYFERLCSFFSRFKVQDGRIISLKLSELTEIPDSIGTLEKLKHLDLTGCNLTKLPESIGNLTELEHLNISNQHKLKTLPKSFGSLKNLNTINLSKTALENVPDSVIQIAKTYYSQKYIDEGVVPEEAYVLGLLEILIGEKAPKLPNEAIDWEVRFVPEISLCGDYWYLLNDEGHIIEIFYCVFGPDPEPPRISAIPEQISELKHLKEARIDTFSQWREWRVRSGEDPDY